MQTCFETSLFGGGLLTFQHSYLLRKDSLCYGSSRNVTLVRQYNGCVGDYAPPFCDLSVAREICSHEYISRDNVRQLPNNKTASKTGFGLMSPF